MILLFLAEAIMCAVLAFVIVLTLPKGELAIELVDCTYPRVFHFAVLHFR